MKVHRSFDASEIPVPRLRWFPRGGVYEHVETSSATTNTATAYRTIVAAEDDRVGQLSFSIGSDYGDPILDVSIEFAVPRWAWIDRLLARVAYR